VKKLISILIISVDLFFGTTVNAVTPGIGEVDKLLADDGAPADYFGYSVAVDGDTAVVGAYGDDDLGNESGAAYIYTRDTTGVWNLKQKLTASDGAADDRFGWVVAVDGNTAVIGKESWDFFAPPPGAAYVFTRDSAGVWTEQQKLTAYDGAAGDYFGESVAVSGNTIVIGADGDDDLGDGAGSAYVFTRDSAGVWSLQQKLTANAGSGGDGFGGSLDIDGDTTVIAAPGYDYNGMVVDSGVAYVFTRDSSGVWTEQQALLPNDPASSSAFAGSLAVSEDSIVIGAWGDDQIDSNTGAAYLFTRDSAGAWSEQQKLSAGDAATGDYFGMSVDIDGSSLVVGAYGDDDNGTDAGSAYVFTRDVNGVWNEELKLLAGDGSDYDYLASAPKAVGISVATVLAGARLDDTSAGASVGSAYVFDIVPNDGPDVAVSTRTVDFGDVVVGQTVLDIVTLSNNGTTDLALSGISITGGVDFSQTNDCPATLLPASACQITVSFSPTLAGALSDVLTILSNDPDEPSVSVTLSGNGITELPDLVVTNITSPDLLIVDDYVAINATISNQGSADVSGGYYVYVYLDDVVLGLDWVSYAPAAGTTKELDWFVPVPRLRKGEHTLTVTVDTNEDIVESDELNNSLSQSVDVQFN
jgi:hypothetical protein